VLWKSKNTIPINFQIFDFVSTERHIASAVTSSGEPERQRWPLEECALETVLQKRPLLVSSSADDVLIIET
jgi:hypothetical protein